MNYTQYSSRYDAFLEGKIAPVFDPNKDGGALMDLNIYNIHLLAALFGLPDKVQYYANMQKGVDTSGILHLSYPDKQASLTASKDSYVTPRSFIEGEKAASISMAQLANLTTLQYKCEAKNLSVTT